ncbi:MAG: beta-hexosaminidase [Clostridiales bacterium]|nr:beta-hexosaminidase [Clostridiales bacterium]
MFRKNILRILAFLLILTLFACTPNENTDNSKPDNSNAVSDASQTTVSEQSDESDESKETSAEINEAVEYAESLISRMTLEEKVGQLFFVRLRKDQAIEDINTYHTAGFIMYAVDFQDETKDSIIQLIASYQEESEIPLLIGVDEEGGTVNRVSRYTAFRDEPFKSPQDLYKAGGLDLIKSDTIEKAGLLLDLGINVNLAPVCDVSADPDDFIYKRAFGKDASRTAEYINTVVTEMVNAGIGGVLKHFPGYGNNEDTHTGIAIDNRDYQTFVDSDFIPFIAGIEAGCNAVMISHNIVNCMDDEYPASLSKKVIDILRNDLGFDGVVMCDDLGMDAIKLYTGDNEAAVLAIQAGNDLLLGNSFVHQIPAVIEAVENNEISVERIEESVLRVLLWKISLGIIQVG